jgi:hypothetical protein
MSLLWVIIVRLITVGLAFTCDKLNVAATDAKLNSAAQWIAVVLVAILGWVAEKHFPALWAKIKGLFVSEDDTPKAAP